MATEAEKVKMYREKAKDETIPQEVRNTYLDRANELERKMFEASKGTPPAKMAKGGAVKKTNMKDTMKTPMKAMAKGGAVKKMMYGGTATIEKPMMANKGGAVKKMNYGGDLPMRGQRTTTNMMSKGGAVKKAMAKKGK